MTAPQRLTDRKREAIIQAAIAEFRANGFEITSMDKIAATAGCRSARCTTISQQGRAVRRNSQPTLGADYRRADGELPRRSAAARATAAHVEAKLQMMADDNFLDWRGWLLLPPFILERAQDMVARMGEREEGLTVWIRAALADGRLKPWMLISPRNRCRDC
jgi:TetR/AcrR family transcriptional regulator of autoinduction and epiphytic fitness